MKRLVWFGTVCLLAATAAFGQQEDVSWSEDFEAYAERNAPSGWLDESDGAFELAVDPQDPDNIVYGVRDSRGRQRSVNRAAPGIVPNIGAHTTFVTTSFAMTESFELRGRVYRATPEALFGITFGSTKPERGTAELLALWRRTGETVPSLRYFALRDGAETTEVSATDVIPAVTSWQRFAIRVDQSADGNRIRARFWPDGETEPRAWLIDTIAADGARATGRIGLWAAVGTTWFDELAVTAEVREESDDVGPAIRFFESGASLAASSHTTFNRNAEVEVRALDASGVASVVLTLDGAPHSSATSIAAERTHRLLARATDAKGNSSEAFVDITVDKTPPVVTLTDGEAAFPDDAFLRRAVVPTFTVEDHTATDVTTLLDGQPFVSGTTVTAEGTHVLTIEAKDAAGWTTTRRAVFTIDLTPPVITLFDGALPVSGRIERGGEVRITIAVADAIGVTTVSALLDGAPYVSGTAIGEAGEHTLVVTAADAAGNDSQVTLLIAIDRIGPTVTIIEGGLPLDGRLTNQPLRPEITVDDPQAIVTATLNEAPFATGSVVDAEGQHLLRAAATDSGGNTNEATASFTIDLTPPVITFITPQPEQHVGDRQILVTGTVDDAIELVLNGAATTFSPAGEFSATLDLIEGENTIAATAVDAAGNQGNASLRVHLDTRAPDLRVLTPAADSCLSVSDLVVRGTARDATKIVVRADDGEPVAAAIEGNGWSATIAVPEGAVSLTVDAEDAAGHHTSVHVPLLIDRTAPVLVAGDSGSAFIGGLFSRVVAPAVRATDADPATAVTITLNGQPHESGSVIANDGTYVLRATAVDCAGNTSPPFELTFTIDRTPPAILSITPATGSAVGSKPPLAGTLSEPASVLVEVTKLAASVDGTSFTLPLPLFEGLNEVALIATDLAGNSSRTPYALRVKTNAPSVEIVENGSAIAEGALFTRAVNPIVRVDDRDATIEATLNGVPFTSGAAVAADGSYDLRAHATDAFGHTSEEARATFAVDRTPPQVRITSPLDGTTDAAASVVVTGTVDADAESVAVNGMPATVTGTAFSVTIGLELGPVTLSASAIDRAGNRGRHSVGIMRYTGGPSIILTSPPNDLLTNRPTTIVAGQVLSMPEDGRVTINGIEVPVSPAGTFRRIDMPLEEGANQITASLAAGSEEREATVGVLADFTPPHVSISANGLELADGARFAASPSIEVVVTDDRPEGLTRQLTLDGEDVVEIVAVADGAHAIVVVGRDAAGNETRVARTFFVGDSLLAGGCALADIQPVDGSAVSSATVQISGRSGGARGVLINGRSAQVADGSFCGDAELQPGKNEVVIQCADAAGVPTEDAPVILVIWRDDAASITIDSPAGGVVTSSTVVVTGTVGPAVVGGDVNGVPFTVADGATSFRADDVALTAGLNVIIATGRTRAGRSAIATATVTLRNATPQLTITSPLPSSEVGGTSVDVSGTWLHVDPATIRVGGVAATTETISDTSGTFTASVPIAGEATIVATASSEAGAEATDSVMVTQRPALPGIAIHAPLDNASVATGGMLTVSGSIDAPPGSLVQVNGVPATLSGSAFSANVSVPAAAGQMPIVARVTTPDSAAATDVVRVHKLEPLVLRDSFPQADAAGVPRGTAVVLLFNNVVDASTAGSLQLTDADGANVEGTRFVDRDSITFAPQTPLRAAMRYSVAGADAVRDASGARLATSLALSFMTEAAGPTQAPLVDDLETSGCFAEALITGRASTGGARVRVLADGVARETVAAESGAFQIRVPFDGKPGFHLVRVQEVGVDGSLSPERALCFRLTCDAPRVVGATLDRNARKLAIDFSRPMDPSTLIAGSGGSILVVPDGMTALSGTVDAADTTAIVTFGTDVPALALELTVTTAAKDASGTPLAADYTQTFTIDEAPGGGGRGHIAGAVYDASTGRPLAAAQITIGNDAITADDRGRYSRAVGEGAHTIDASMSGYTRVWRHLVVPAGAGVVPVDIRLTRRAEGAAADGSQTITLHDGSDTSITQPLDLTVPIGALPAGERIRLTSVGAQSLAALLPLGWSPLGAAEIFVDGSESTTALPGAVLTFLADDAAVSAASQTLSVVRYDEQRDEWRVLIAAAGIAGDGTIDVPLIESGNYALVYPDIAPHLARPPVPVTGGALEGAADVCAVTPAACTVTSRSFSIEPRAVLPSGRAVATLLTDGTMAEYPSGTAVQATIDERLNTADGRVLLDPPFVTDLLLYRSLDGETAVAAFHVAPSPLAAGVTLRDGVESIRINEYPGRIERGALLGAEGGRVPGDGGVTIDVAPGATIEPLHARGGSLTDDDLAALGSVAGFTVAGGFEFTLTRASDVQVDEPFVLSPPALAIPARVSFAVPETLLSGAASQVILAEVLPQSEFGLQFRLVAVAEESGQRQGARAYATRAIDSTQLPLDGIVREGRYLILVANDPIAFAYGVVRAGESGIAVADARVVSGVDSPMASPFGVTDVTAIGGLFVVPVAANPAAPFSLVPRTLAAGEGAVAVASAAPDVGAFVDVGILLLAPQAPGLVSVTPDGGEIDVAGAFTVRAEFDRAIDPSSALGGIRVTNETTGEALAGSVAAAGTIVTFNASEPLRAASRYSIVIEPTLRALNGTPFGQLVVKSFTTSARPYGSTEFNTDRIRITIPDATGRATVLGTAGALPSGAQALAVRRDTSFIEMYQATVATDGSFRFDAGHNDPRDAIALTDAIDLHVLDAVSRAVIAIIPLTPFSSEDGRSFITRPGRETTFTSADGIVVRVPAGAFAHPTVVEVTPGSVDAFGEVPGFGTELRVATSVVLDFDGIAAEPLDVEMPVPEGVDSSGNWLLGAVGQSVRGPRVMIVDLLHLEGDFFVTGPADVVGGAAWTPTPEATVVGEDLREHLIKVTHAGQFAAVTLAASNVAFAIVGGPQASYDLFWDAFDSLYVAHYYFAEGRDRVAIPIKTDVPFTVIGVDARTGIEVFSKFYDPVPSSENGGTVVLGELVEDRTGPVPISGSPFRIENIVVEFESEPIRSIRGYEITLESGTITVRTELGGAVMNVRTGELAHVRNGVAGLEGMVGDRVVLMSGATDVDAASELTVVFDDEISFADIESLRNFVFLEVGDASGTFRRWDVGTVLRFDSGRRIRMSSPGLVRGGRYRLVIDQFLQNTSGLRVGQTKTDSGTEGGLTEPLYFEFTIRAPKGRVAGFELPEGSSGAIRDQALNGNLLLLAAGSSGILAYDVSNPATLSGNVAPVGNAKGDAFEYWSLATDHHSRVFATGVGSLFGVVHSFRLEDFVEAEVAPIHGGGIVSYVPGAASGMLVPSGIIGSDRPEAFPRKIQILVQDDEEKATATELKDLFGAEITGVIDGAEILAIEFERAAENPYMVERITVENVTRDMRWSADAVFDKPAVMNDVVAYPDDEFRIIRNRTTYGVISLFGFGVGVYDLNAIESNDSLLKSPGYEPLLEQIRLTNGAFGRACAGTEPWGITDLSFSPESAIFPTRGGSLKLTALEVHRGILGVVVQTPGEGDSKPAGAMRRIGCEERAPNGLVLRNVYIDEAGLFQEHDHPRLRELRARLIELGMTNPRPSFNTIARYHWSVIADDNRPTTVGDAPRVLGQRGTVSGTAGSREYVLVPARDYGLLMIEVPADGWLDESHLADIIWIPDGAMSVRVIPGTALATVVNGVGAVMLVDLSRTDERWDENGRVPDTDLFATVAGVLDAGVDAPDPRILWTSKAGLATGTLAPIIDPETGFLYLGKVLQWSTEILSIFDPKIRIKADGGKAGLVEIGGIVPLGVAPPAGLLGCVPESGSSCSGSLAAFRFEITLPGSMNETAVLMLRLENERVFGVRTADTPEGWPRAHLTVPLKRNVPDVPSLRFQRGYNKWISDWIVAVGDIRASKNWTGSRDGCLFCEPPASLRDTAYTEIFTNGATLTVGVDAAALTGTPYGYLAQPGRLDRVITSVAADTVRPQEAAIAAQNPPVADGALQETTFVHSGEIATSHVDLHPGGRSGFDVVIDRTYLSRTIGDVGFGAGWDSSLFRRLRPLPDGTVEYRDGSGAIRTFKRAVNGFTSPGFFQRLHQTADGWALVDLQRRMTNFNRAGRIVSETDRFFDSTGGGNIIRYLYDDEGRLSRLVDPVGRVTELHWDTDGRVHEIVDWRGRRVTYHYTSSCLERVDLPEAAAADSLSSEFAHLDAQRPQIVYTYDQDAGGGNLEDRLELKTNLLSITEPAEVADGGEARVAFTYHGSPRDRVHTQVWGTGEGATFTYGDVTTVIDVLGQRRTYELTRSDQYDGRIHIRKVTEHDVPVLAFGSVPDAADPLTQPEDADLTTSIEYNEQGLVELSVHPDVAIDPSYVAAPDALFGLLTEQVVENSAGGDERTTRYAREADSNLVNNVTRSAGDGTSASRSTPQPTRTAPSTTVTDDGVSVITTFDEAGRVRVVEQMDAKTAKVSARSETTYRDTGDLIARARPFVVSNGIGDDSREEYSFIYETRPDGGEFIRTRDEVRGTITETVLDSYGRTLSTVVRDSEDAVLTDERFGYDASGRLNLHQRTQKPIGTVVSRFEYDSIGRLTKSSITDAQVGGAAATVIAETRYDLSSRRIRKLDPTTGAGTPAELVTSLDRLGRPSSVERVTSALEGTRIVTRYAHDRLGRMSFETDGLRVATVYGYDGLGRLRDVVGSDGIHQNSDYSVWDEPIRVVIYDGEGVLFNETRNFFTSRGRIRSTNESIDGVARKTHIARIDGGARTIIRTDQVYAMDEPDIPTNVHRTREVLRDPAGRVVEQRIREVGVPAGKPNAEDTWSVIRHHWIGDTLRSTTAWEPKSDVTYTTTFDVDALGRVTGETAPGGYVTSLEYDEAGNVVESRAPGMAPRRATYDSRGLVTERTLADGKTQQFIYDALGGLRQRKDEAGETTIYDYDPLGRPTTTRYADAAGTFEEVRYEDLTGMVRATRNRAGQWLSYAYDSGGRVVGIHSGEALESAPLLIQYEYDAARRLSVVRNKDASIAYEEYDHLGRPHVTRTTRYRNATGFESSPQILDVHEQRHSWSIHDEREEWTMPRAAAGGPNEAPIGGDEGFTKWLRGIRETRDGGSNLVTQESVGGYLLATASSRAAGLIDRRDQRGRGGVSIGTTYGFADGKPLPQPLELPPVMAGATLPESGMPWWAETTVNETPVAGAVNLRDEAGRLRGIRDAGTQRLSRWSYDARGRLEESITRTSLESTSSSIIRDTLIDADFRRRREVPPALTPAQHTLLGAALAQELEPLTWSVSRAAGHQLGERTSSLYEEEAGTDVYAFTGGRRITDGAWTYSFDDFGRMTSATSSDRRIVYVWDPNDRLVGRTAYQPSGEGVWALESRTTVLARDGLPAATTFVWDPIVDRLVAIYEEGASIAEDAPADAGLLRQYLHGDRGYDDPVRVLVRGFGTALPVVYFPVLDEAGSGSLTAVLDFEGNLVERVLYADAYGDAPRYLHGPIVHKIELQVAKTPAGLIDSVRIRARLSERIAAGSLATGASLRTIKDDHSVAYTHAEIPELENDYTLVWDLTPSEWNALASASGASSLEVSVTNQLRARAWGATPVQRTPQWALKLYPGTASTVTDPVIYRHSLAAISTFAAGVGNGRQDEQAVFELPSLYLAGSEESRTQLLSGFQALPFAEPATGLVYARARWYDPSTGSFLTPDPMGYVDSSNLYAFCGGDPVNCSDPTGEWGLKEAWESTKSLAGFVVGVTETVGEAVHNLNPAVSTYRTIQATVPRVKRVVSAYETGGVGAATDQYLDEVKSHAADLAKGLPIVNTARQIAAIPEAFDAGSFEGGRQIGRATVSLAGDATIVYGGVRALQQGRGRAPAPPPEPINTKKWTATEIEGRRVYQRSDLFEPSQVSAWRENGKVIRGTNLERMRTGRAPIGVDGREIQLHHLTQTEWNGLVGTPGAVAELTGTMHSQYSRVLHMPRPAVPRHSSFRKKVDGTVSTQSLEFDAFRQRYWRNRATGF